jgi:hypothetical protein
VTVWQKIDEDPIFFAIILAEIEKESETLQPR